MEDIQQILNRVFHRQTVLLILPAIFLGFFLYTFFPFAGENGLFYLGCIAAALIIQVIEPVIITRLQLKPVLHILQKAKEPGWKDPLYAEEMHLSRIPYIQGATAFSQWGMITPGSINPPGHGRGPHLIPGNPVHPDHESGYRDNGHTHLLLRV